MSTTLPADMIDYADLYTRWERGNWSAMDLDFTEDARQWREDFSPFERKAALWNYALFFWGEDAVAADLSPYIMAAPLEEQKYFLMTQQVDEARHAVFFKRFVHEVCGLGDGSMGSSLAAISPQLTPGFRRIFARLERMSQQLERDPSVPRLAAAIVLYHFVVEATLAQPGQHMILDYLTKRDALPAFREGMERLSHDEERHVAFGVKCVADLARQDERVPAAVAKILRDVVPYTSQVLMPPNWDESYLTVFGFGFDQVGTVAVTSLRGKMRAAGLPIEDLPGPPVMLPGLTPEEISRRGREMAQAGILGERDGPTRRDEQTVSMLFDTIGRQVDLNHTMKVPTVLQWEFLDADISPWYIVFDDHSAEVHEGLVPHPDLRMRVAYQDFVDIVGRRLSPARAVLTGRLRLRGRPGVFRQIGTALPL